MWIVDLVDSAAARLRIGYRRRAFFTGLALSAGTQLLTSGAACCSNINKPAYGGAANAPLGKLTIPGKKQTRLPASRSLGIGLEH